MCDRVRVIGAVRFYFKQTNKQNSATTQSESERTTQKLKYDGIDVNGCGFEIRTIMHGCSIATVHNRTFKFKEKYLTEIYRPK